MSEFHLVAMSGGKDSTAMALRLADVEPRDYTYVCTPTLNELPEMESHWRKLENLLEADLVRLTVRSLDSLIREYGALPNHRMRWCTRQIKIEPYGDVLERMAKAAPTTSYVGLRADEPLRLGGIYEDLPNVTVRHPLREWGWGLVEVQSYVAARGVCIPKRTDCGLCFFQRIGEWFDLWREHPDRWAEGEAYEALTGHTFRSSGRDSWPVALVDLRRAFEAGRIPRRWGQGDLLASMQCRVCSL